MTALEFKKVWEDYTELLQKETDWLALWNSDSEWTNEVQNNASTNEWHWSKAVERILRQEHPKDKFIFHPEHRKIDFVAASALTNQIESMWADGSKIAEDELRFGFMELMVELENDFAACFKEMIKLTKHRARLKVLVAYDYDHKSEPSSDWIDVAARNWYSIIGESQQRLSEPGVEYLLIVGQMSHTNTQPKLRWRYFSDKKELFIG